VASIANATHENQQTSGGLLLLLGRILLPIGLFAIAMFGGGVAAHASSGNGKVSADLRAALERAAAG